MIFRSGVLVAAVLLLCSCRIGASIEVDQRPSGEVNFKVTLENGNSVCVDSIAVQDIETPHANLWVITRQPAATCRSEFAFPMVPNGYLLATENPAPSMRAGKTYEVSVSGGGLLGSTRFVRRT